MAGSAITSHIVILPIAGWGHIRPATQLGLNLLKSFPDVAITYLADRRGAKRIRQELSAFPKLVKSVHERYQVTELIHPNGEEIPDDKQKEIFEEATDNLERCLADLYAGNAAFPRPPDTLIIDFMRGEDWIDKSRQVVKEAHAKSPILSLLAVMTTVMSQRLHAVREMEKTGKVPAHGIDDVMTFSDCPPLTVGQQFPQHVPGHPVLDPNKIEERWRMLGRPMLKVDGIVTCGVPEIEPNADLPSGMNLYPVGVSVLEALGEEDIPEVMNNPRYRTDCGEVIQFLDDSVKRSGPKSVAYVSLGSVIWPKHKPEIVDWLLLSLLEHQPELNILVALAAADAELSEGTKRRLEESGRAHISSWVPQRSVLAHEATSFFVSHCGWGSASEAVMAGIPIVAVPQFGDQPIVAAKLIDMGCAVQLWQFCTGLDGHKLVNGTVIQGTEAAAIEEMRATWTAMTGEKGRTMRQNMLKTKETFKMSAESGGAKKGLEALKLAATVEA